MKNYLFLLGLIFGLAVSYAGTNIANAQLGDGSHLFEFSVDIGSDSELSDPNADGDEVFDPGDIYLWQTIPLPAGGEDGIKDDGAWFGRDPYPDPPDQAQPPITAVPVGNLAGVKQYAQYLDIDGHDQIDTSLIQIIPAVHFQEPIPQFESAAIFNTRSMAVSFDDDSATGWPKGDVPVTAFSPVLKESAC